MRASRVEAAVVLLAAMAAAGCGRVGYEPQLVCEGPCELPDPLADAGPGGTTIVGDAGIAPDAGAGTSGGADGGWPGGACGTDTHDEDGDGIADACDNCPSIANAEQADLGESAAGAAPDGVGDACDPRPSGGGDSIRVFEAFAGTAPAAGWSTYGGIWAFGGDVAAQIALDSAVRLDYAALGISSRYLVETSFTFDGFETGSTNAGLVFQVEPGNGKGWICGIFRADSPPGSLMLWAMTGDTAGFQEASADLAAVPQIGDRYRIWGGAYDREIYCSADTGEQAWTNSPRNPSGQPGLRTNRTQSTYEYVVVYGLGGPL